jgi:arginyl-tRNA synthetase
LIQQLCEALDYLATATTSSQQGLKVTLRLSQAFQRFHAASRIWGLEQQEQPLAQVRLGLVLLTRKVLRSLIEARLGWKAPSEL